MHKGTLGCFHRLKTTRSAVHILLTCGLLTLCIQICIFLILLYSAESEFNWALHLTNSYFSDPVDDLDIIRQVFTDFGLSCIIVDETFLKLYESKKSTRKASNNCDVCQFLKYHALQFATDKSLTKEVSDALRNLKFHVVEFRNIKPETFSKDLNLNITTGYVLKRYFSFFVVVLHGREDNVWWYGSINSDTETEQKLSAVGISHSFINHIQAVKHEGIFNKFETVGRELTGTHVDFLFPKNVSQFLNDSRSSKYIECNWERARRFEQIHGSRQSTSALRFRHRAWKLLSKTKVVFQSLGVDFWLSSGTLLGFTRECNIIPYSKDVDIGVMADSYTDSLHHVMSTHGFHLLIQLGKPEDSFELSFTDQSGIKLDIFFFYKNPNGTVWNGGTQVKSGKKFKYTFPRFELCWTLFQGLKVRVPCNNERYIEANYGPDWFAPVTEWDWKTSPFNVQPNGIWAKEEWPQVIQVFH